MMIDGFANVNQRFDDTNQRMTDGFANLQRQIDELQADVRELEGLLEGLREAITGKRAA